MFYRIIHIICEFLKIPEGIHIPYFGYLWYMFLSRIENWCIRSISIKGYPINISKRDKKVIISLTSYPSRIRQVDIAIKSLMLQSYKPDRIILWIADSQLSIKDLPNELTKLISLGLEIKFCKDYKSHKKYFEVLQQQHNDELVVTFDDDIIYPQNILNKTIKMHLKYPNCIICNRGYEITFNSNNTISDYNMWRLITNKGLRRPSIKIMPSTGYGTLYPPNIFNSPTFEWEIIRKNAISTDDIWIKFMSVLNKVQVMKTSKYVKTLTTTSNSQYVHLAEENIYKNENNNTIKRLCLLYPLALKNLLENE